MVVQVVLMLAQRCSCPGPDITEPPLLEFLLEIEIHHLLPVGRHSGKLLRVTHLVNDFDFIHNLRRKVAQGDFRVVEEEGLTTYCNLFYCFSVVSHRAIRAHFHSWHSPQQVLQHLVLPHLERGCIEYDSILFHLNRVANGRDSCSIEQFDIFRQPDHPQIFFFFREVVFSVIGLVTEHLHGETVGAPRNFLDRGKASGVGQCEVGNQGIVLRSQIDRRVRNWRITLLLNYAYFDHSFCAAEEFT